MKLTHSIDIWNSHGCPLTTLKRFPCTWYVNLMKICTNSRHAAFYRATFSARVITVRQLVEFNLAVLVYKALNNLGTTVSVRRLPARCHHRAPPASIIRQFSVHCHLYQFTSWTASIRCCWTMPLERSSYTHVRRLDLSLDTLRRKLKTYLGHLFEAQTTNV